MPVNEASPCGDADRMPGLSRGPGGAPEEQGAGRAAKSTACDLSAVPDWAREDIARTEREHPESLPGRLSHVAEIEAARGRLAGRPLPPPPPPGSARDFLHLAAIEAWQATASGQPSPAVDPVTLFQAMDEAFRASDGTCLTDQLYFRWEAIAGRRGFPVHDEHGDLLPEVDAEVTGLITAAIWFGVTTGYFALAGNYEVPRRLLA